jgi:hypothetical protein
MGRYSAHDRLVNTRTPGRRFDLVYDSQSDRKLYQPLDGIVASAGLSPGDRVWCVMPFEIGPAAARQACQVTGPGLERLPDVVASRSLLRSYLVR